MLSGSQKYFGFLAVPSGEQKIEEDCAARQHRGRHWNNCWALGGQAWLGGKACGEIHDLGVEGCGNV